MQRQARAAETQPFGAEAFEASDGTVLRWLGMAGFLINSRGTTVMVDPLLGGFDMPVMIEFPIAADDVPKLDAVLVTHSDNDHYSAPTCGDLARVTGEYHSTQYVASLMKQQGLPAYGHDIGEHFAIGPVGVEVTPADHAWQNDPRARAIASSNRRTAAAFGSTHQTAPFGRPAIHGSSPTITCACPPQMRCCSTSPTASGTSDSTALSRWRTPTHTPRCCCTTGAAWMRPTFRRSMPTQTLCRTASKIRNAFRSWRLASHSYCGDCRADQTSRELSPPAVAQLIH